MKQFSALLSLVVVAAVDAASLTVSSTQSQAIHGFGASGAWWPNDLASFPASAKQQAANLLFDKSAGIGLTTYRYNVGGGGKGVSNPTRAPQTTFISPGVYNFSADPQGGYFLRAAAAAKVPQLVAFVNSAPPSFTTNGASCGGQLSSSSVDAYTKYLADVINYWKGQGVAFTHVSPMNEPDNSFGSGSNCGQEGMIVPPSLRAQVVNSLRTALNNANLGSVGIIADETSTSEQFLSETSTWLPNAKNSIVAVAHHQYSFPSDSTAAQMGQLSHSQGGGKESWFTEICCFAAADSSRASDPAAPLSYQSNYDPTIVGGLQMGGLIFQAFTQTGDAHFDWWTALSNGLPCSPASNAACATAVHAGAGWNDGLIYYDPSFASNRNTNLYTTKRFFILKHFAQFVPIGSIRRNVTSDTSSLRAMAFDLPNNAGVNLLVMNFGSSAQSISATTLVEGRKLSSAFVTSGSADYQQLSFSTTVSLPGFSLVTLRYV